jgi:hypothetical protein
VPISPVRWLGIAYISFGIFVVSATLKPIASQPRLDALPTRLRLDVNRRGFAADIK